MLRLRGIDATLYVRFLRGCFWWALLHTVTTFPVLFAIHVHFADEDISPKSMTRASISSLVLTTAGRELLWVHVCSLFWLTITWIGVLLWLCHGAFGMRGKQIDAISQHIANREREHADNTYYPHPHPQYAFRDVTPIDPKTLPSGLQCRTVMVSNLPPTLRTEKELKEYFEYYLSRKVDKPAIGLTSSTHPGFLNKSFAFLFNRAKRLPGHIPTSNLAAAVRGQTKQADTEAQEEREDEHKPRTWDAPEIERVVVVRKLTELASLLERREELLQSLEVAHIKLAKKTLTAVCNAMQKQKEHLPLSFKTPAAAVIARVREELRNEDADQVMTEGTDPDDEDARERCMQDLIKVLSPYVEDFDLTPESSVTSRFPKPQNAFRRLRGHTSEDDNVKSASSASYPPSSSDDPQKRPEKTIWEALLSVPRTHLDPYQPLYSLGTFKNQLVPSIDYHTLKLNFMCSLIMEQRSKAQVDHAPVSTAFVTFADPADARRACQYLAVHPNNPLLCIVTPAPSFNDLDWTRLMKLSFTTEFVKDWVVNVGVWGFTIFWLFPVSSLVALVSIQSISAFWPSLRKYLETHPWEAEVLQSFVPTILVALLAITVPLLLLLIGKKAHNTTTLSALHDRILTRYYKFLIVNVLVFFCVGTAAVQSLLTSFKITSENVVDIVATSFPSAGPFYVGWLIFTTAMHSGFELALLGLPLIMYPATSNQITPRKRAVGTRPRTFNFYYWLPNHLLVLHVLLVFALLNPLVWVFGMLYFFVASGVVKNQLLHVYAKHYEQNGHNILIRVVRYSLDGAILSQTVFLAYMLVLKKSVNVGLTVFLMVFTLIFKIMLTRICRYQFELDDIKESEVLCGEKLPGDNTSVADGENDSHEGTSLGGDHDANRMLMPDVAHPHARRSVWSNRFPSWANLSYATVRRRPEAPHRRKPNPFHEHEDGAGRPKSIPADFDRIDDPQISGGSQRDSKQRPLLHRNTISDTSEISAMLVEPRIITLPSPRQNSQDNQTVRLHGPTIPWDDSFNVELPYDNPYYTRTITNTLWLPRNPFGILDLDDTVDVDDPITSTISQCELEQWMGDAPAPARLPEIAVTPDASAPAPTSPGVEDSGMSVLSFGTSYLSPSPFTGEEDIELSPVLQKRALIREGDIERPPIRRRSTFRKRTISKGDSVRRQPSTILNKRSFRSISAGSQPRDRTLSILSVLNSPTSMDGAKSIDNIEQEFGVRGTSLAIPGDAISENAGSCTSDQSRRRLTRSGNVTARDAIVHEVLVEHEQEKEQWQEQEQRERQNTAKRWFFSWMFKKA